MAFAESGPARGAFLPLRWFVIPLVLAVAALAGEGTDIDRVITRGVFDAASGSFPLRTTFMLDVVMHHWAKYAVVTIGCCVAAGYVLSFLLPALRPVRGIALFLLLALALAPLSVTLGKAVSERHCPWDIDEFGGLVPYRASFEKLPPGIEPGHCFPAGHASTGFALMAFYLAAYAAGRTRAARVMLGVGLVAGVVLGGGRVLQGAHFASHVVWSGLLCWVVMVALYALILSGDRSVAA
jgi:membrane-associated PAP2 superfamily phosphatase